MSPFDTDSFVAAINSLDSTSRGLGEVLKQRDPSAINAAYHELLESCRNLFNAEVCAIFLVRGPEVVLEAHLGYELPGGFPIKFADLQRQLRYKIGSVGDSKYDGITGLVASTGKEFGADSWDEIKQHPSHVGKPDWLRIWSADRQFRCVFAVPLILGNKTIGVLKVENKRGLHQQGASFSETDKLLLRTLSQFFCLRLGDAGFSAGERFDSDTVSLATLAQRFDFYDMNKVIEQLPRQIEIALAQELPAVPSGPFKGAVVVGMGGSALPVDVIATAFRDRLNVPLTVVRGYQLPSSVTSDHLIIASSFSGNTEETLAAIERLPIDARNVVCVTVGGWLRTLAKDRNYPLIQLDIKAEPDGFQPRSAVGYFVAYLSRVLTAAGVLADIRAELAAVPPFLRSIDFSIGAESTARWLQDKIPIVYCDEVHQSAIGRTAKIKFNENSKRPAFYGALPEVNHNEMIGFTTRLGRFGILYFHDHSSDPRVQRRFRVMEQVFAEAGLDHVSFREWDIPGETRIEKIFAALAFAERCSYDLALLDGLDPTPVNMVERFKSALAQ